VDKTLNRESILKKIDAQEREWNNQLEYLHAKVSCFDPQKRLEFEQYVVHLNSKLKTIESQTTKLRNASLRVWEKHGENISECWTELVHNVDYVIANYVRIFNQ
jgi:hypothetical protein